MTVKWTTAGLVTIIAVLAIALGLKSCAPTPDAKIPPALQKTIDSLNITAPAFSAHRDSVITVVVQDTSASRRANARADSATIAAGRIQRTADSLAVIARSSPDTSKWSAALDAQKRVSDSLRTALVEKDSAYQKERTNTLRLLAVVRDDTLRMNVITDARRRLERRISELEIPCRVVGPIPCPSRTVTMVLTTVVVTAAETAARRH